MPEVSRRTGCLIAIGMVGLAACANPDRATTAPGKPDKVQIAVEGPFTGDQASIGGGALQAIALALGDFNKQGGVHGTPVQLVIWDDAHNAGLARTLQAEGLSDPSIMGIVGPMNSAVAEASEPSLQGANPPLAFISESASASKVTDAGFSVAHRIIARDDAQAAADGKFLIDQGAKRVEILDSATDDSRPLAEALNTHLKTNSSSIVTDRSTIASGQRDFGATIARIRSFNADWVFLADEGTESAALVQQMAQANLKIGQNIQFLGTSGSDDPALITSSQGAYLGAYASSVTPDPRSLPGAASFVAAFTKAYGNDAISRAGPYYGSAYAATQVLLQAISKAPVKTGKISRADVLNHLASDTFTTILGPVTFDHNGDLAGASVAIFQARGTDMVAVK